MAETIELAEEKTPRGVADFIPDAYEGMQSLGDLVRGFQEFMKARLEFEEANAIAAENHDSLKSGVAMRFDDAIMHFEKRYDDEPKFGALREAMESGMPINEKSFVERIAKAKEQLKELDDEVMPRSDRYARASLVYQDLGAWFRVRACDNAVMRQLADAFSETPSDIMNFFRENKSVMIQGLDALMKKQCSDKHGKELTSDGVFGNSVKFERFARQNEEEKKEDHAMAR